jgi:hypothetical protein
MTQMTDWLANAEAEIAKLERYAKDDPQAHFERREAIKEAARRLSELSRRLSDLVRT